MEFLPIHEIKKPSYSHLPIKALQFGEGNFLRAFADWMIDLANERGAFNGSIAVCQPIAQGMCQRLAQQQGMYTVLLRGLENGRPVERSRVVTSVSRCLSAYEDFDALLDLAASPDLQVILSNTTEAGISYKEGDLFCHRPPSSFPAKLTLCLYRRYQALGPAAPGLLILPVELIDNNGGRLRELVLRYAGEWGLDEGFLQWIRQENCFADTLVDRIVTGYPAGETGAIEESLGYHDSLLVTCEPFQLWVIDAPEKWRKHFPVDGPGVDVVWAEDITPYKTRKVRILNGAHTASITAAYLAGHETVLDMMGDPVFRSYLERLLFQEVIPTLSLPRNELEAFAQSVLERFSNPYIAHRLPDIALNCCSKYAARCLPSLLEYSRRRQAVPPLLAFSLAAFLAFYRGLRNGEPFPLRDEPVVLEFFGRLWATGSPEQVVQQALAHTEFWAGCDLTTLPGLSQAVARQLNAILTLGSRTALELLLEEAL